MMKKTDVISEKKPNSTLRAPFARDSIAAEPPVAPISASPRKQVTATGASRVMTNSETDRKTDSVTLPAPAAVRLPPAAVRMPMTGASAPKNSAMSRM